MRLLAIDTSNQTLSIGVCEENKILGQYTTTVKKNHSLTLMPALTELMKNLDLSPKDIDRFVVAEGPGSYTGLRIGVTTAKTLAYTLKKELVGVSSLRTVAANCVGIDGLIIPLFDARRKNVYTGAYEIVDGNLISRIKDQHISIEEWLHQLIKYPALYFVGADTEVFRGEIEAFLPHAKINAVPQWQIPSATVLAELGRTADIVTDIHNFLPNYLKRVEAEENWLKNHTPQDENYVEKI